MWFSITIISVFLFAVASIADKFILTKSKLFPVSFAFYVGLLGALTSSILIFFEKGFYFPSDQLLILSLGGAGFYFAIYFMYLAVVKHEISRVNPMINSLVPAFVYFISLSLAIEFISQRKLLGAAIIIIGGYLLSQVGLKKTRIDKRSILFIVLAAVMFGVSNAFSKVAYDNVSFITAFVWMRWLTFAVALVFTSIIGGWPKVFFKKKSHKKDNKKNPWLALAVGQVSGGIAVIFFQYAIKLGSVTIVTSLLSLQYFFLLILTVILSKKFPYILKEPHSPIIIKKKLLYCLLLAIGVILVLI